MNALLSSVYSSLPKLAYFVDCNPAALRLVESSESFGALFFQTVPVDLTTRRLLVAKLKTVDSLEGVSVRTLDIVTSSDRKQDS